MSRILAGVVMMLTFGCAQGGDPPVNSPPDPPEDVGEPPNPPPPELEPGQYVENGEVYEVDDQARKWLCIAGCGDKPPAKTAGRGENIEIWGEVPCATCIGL